MRELLDKLDTLQAKIRKVRAVNVNDKNTKQASIDAASRYFSAIRPKLVATIGESEELLAHDDRWQDLIRLAQGNNLRQSYRKAVQSLKKELSTFNVAALSRVAERGVDGGLLSDLTPAEKLIVETLDRFVSSAAASYRQGILDLRDGQRLSYRGTASEFREALREVLDHLAPDNEVKKQPGFKIEANRAGPTMKQKVRFILTSRERSKTQRQVAEKSIDLIDGLIGEITRATYDRASLATHVETTRSEVMKIKRYVDTVLFDLLEISEGS